MEASAEIQQAARRVVEENKKLRALLNEHGIDEATITSYLQVSGPTASPLEESALHILDRLLAPLHPSFDSDSTPLLSPSDFDQDGHLNSVSFDTTSATRPLLSSSAEGTQHHIMHHRYGSLSSVEDFQSYSPAVPTFPSESIHRFDMEASHLHTPALRPNFHLQRQTVSDPTGTWINTSQISPDSTIAVHDVSPQRGELYGNRPVQFPQRQAPSLSDQWHATSVTGPVNVSSGISRDGLSSLMRYEATRLHHYHSTMEEDDN